MDQETRKLLLQWRLLEDDGNLRAVDWRWRLFNFVGLLCSLAVVFGLIYGLHPIAIAVAAAIGGAMAAQTTFVLTRRNRWPIFKKYINWQQVHDDLKDDRL